MFRFLLVTGLINFLILLVTVLVLIWKTKPEVQSWYQSILIVVISRSADHSNIHGRMRWGMPSLWTPTTTILCEAHVPQQPLGCLRVLLGHFAPSFLPQCQAIFWAERSLASCFVRCKKKGQDVPGALTPQGRDSHFWLGIQVARSQKK